ncbi:hypothetical protein CUB95_02070 [Prevotella intermedia]|nr:hypothetical protein CUB95_02070 [Prevotella intermedia]
MCCKTYCLAFQKRRFCTVKAYVLCCKRAAFAMPNRNYHFSNELYLQNGGGFIKKLLLFRSGVIHLQYLFFVYFSPCHK